jgi:IS5 family transposase
MGEGEWARAKHGVRGTRGWKKLHLGVDRSGVIIGHALTDATVDDATTAIELITAVDGGLTSVTGDAAYDSIAFYDAAGPVARPSWCHRPKPQGYLDRSRGRALAIARFGGCTRSDGDGGRRRLATIGRPVWRTPSSDTSRSSGIAFTRAVWQGSGLRPSSHATSSIR